ncbi:fibronectin type III domain-containing protein [Streptomyces tendae]|uniref:fibronectin type III domain-containing protein n=1 Tax=Streptomyces tendae TaxID=1932 RepID=UPI00364F2EB7
MAAAAVPAAPEEVTGIPRDRGATLSWKAPSDDGGSAITGYRITATPGGATVTVEGAATSGSVYGLTNGTPYTFTVVAINAEGDGPASAASAGIVPKEATAPSAVQDLQVSAGNARATVTWKAPADDGGADIRRTLVRIYESADDSYVGYVSATAPATEVEIANLVVGTAYYVKVYTENRSYYTGSTVQSEDFTPHAGPEPAPPASATAEAGTGRATVGWEPPVEDGGSPVTGYVVIAYDSSDEAVGAPVTVTQDKTTASVTGLTNGSWYYFGVAATNANGTGPETYTVRVRPATAPGAPTAITGFPQNRAAFVVWKEPGDDGGSPVTSYTVTAKGPDGTEHKTVSGPSALFSGLDNGSSYTFTVTAANDVTSGAPSGASGSVKPSDSLARPVGEVGHAPEPLQTEPDTKFVEARYMPIISGNGRYVFYYGNLVAETLDGDYLYSVRHGWYRYDINTGETITVWWYSGGGFSIGPNTWAATSYDGQTFSSYGGSSLYVWHADTGRNSLVSANASGEPTSGGVSNPSMSSDGRYIVFSVSDNQDMADRSTCTNGNKFNGVPYRADLYRFDTTTSHLQRVPLELSVDNATVTCTLPSAWGNTVGVSARGDRIASLVDFAAIPAGGTAATSHNAELVITDLASGGSGNSTWVPLQKAHSWGWNWNFPIQLSDDGSKAVAVLDHYDDAAVEHVEFVSVNADSPTSAPFVFANAESAEGLLLSRDGRWAGTLLNGGSNADASQSVLLDTSSGDLVAASQVNGALAEVGTRPLQAAVDGTGRRVVMATNAPNMLGRTDCASQSDLWGGDGCVSDIVIADLADGTVGVLPNQALGCTCRSSLGRTAALQNFVGDPVNTATGSYTEAISDALLPGSGVSFDFQRTYNSAAAATSGPLGPGWSEPYAMSLTVSGDTVTFTSEDGAKSVFTKQPDGSFTSSPGVRAQLAATSGGYTLTLPDQQVNSFDSAGRLTAMRDRNGRGLTFSHTDGQLTGVKDSGGRNIAVAHDPATGNISKLTLPDGQTVRYGYDTSGRLSTVTDTSGQTTTYGYDSDDRLITVTSPSGHQQVENTYDQSTGRVTSQTQNNGSEVKIAWDAQQGLATTTEGDRVTKDYYSGNVLVAHVDAAGGLTTYTYDDQLNPTSVTDPNGRTTHMTYDASGNLLTRKAPAPVSTAESWTYDSRRNVKSHTNGRGNTESYTYDGDNRISSITDPEGGATTFTYTTGGRIETVKDPAGQVTTNSYDTAGNLTAQSDALGNKSTYTYDDAGRVLTVTTPRGNVDGADPADYTTTYTYDDAGRVASVTDPLGHTSSNTYDEDGHLVEAKDAEGDITTYAYDDAGRQTGKTDANGNTVNTAYNPYGEITSVTDALGNKSTYTYDDAGRVLTVTTPRGNVDGADPGAHTTAFTYDKAGNRTAVIDPLGDETNTTYDALNRPTTLDDPLGNVTTTQYDANGNVTTVTAPTGAVTTYTYDKNDRRVSSTDPLGNKTTYAYDAVGRTLSETSPSGATTTYAYDDTGRLESVTDPRGNAEGSTATDYTTHYSYGPDGNLLSETDPLGNHTTYAYDRAGRQISVTDPDGHTTTTAYDAVNRPTAVEDALGKLTSTAYDPIGNVLSVTNPLGQKTSYSYDAANRRTSVMSARGNEDGADPAAHTTTYSYDPNGNRTAVTDPLGHTTTTAYDAANRPVTVTDPLGHTTTTTYDAAGNTTSVTDPTGAELKSAYDENNRLASSTDALGNKTSFTYDKAGHQLTRTTAVGSTTSSTYDSDGRLESVTDPRGNTDGAAPADYTTTYGYDLTGNRTTVTDPLGHTTTTAYDANNRQTKVTDPLERATTYAYDAENRLTEVTDPTGAATEYTYDLVGNLLTRTDAKSHTTSYTYDDAQHLTGVTDPLDRKVTYGYDADGNRITTKNARGITTTATVDARGLTSGFTHSDDTPDVAYTYDDAGRRTSITDGTGTRTLTYDAAGRIMTVSAPDDTARTFTYAYDSAGHIASRTFPDGATTTYTYDADGRQKTQTANGATITYGYDEAGNLTTTTLPSGNGYADTRTYDRTGRLASITTADRDSTLASWTLKRDAAGQPTQLDTVRADGSRPPQYYGYDDAGRLASWCTSATEATGCSEGSALVEYTYDKVGNRATMAKKGRTTTYTYDAADELTRATTGLIRQVYTYDADGNYTGNGSTASTITYDAHNQPIAAVQAGKNYTFVNDDQGNRVSTSTDGTLTRTDTWDVNNALPQLATSTDGSGDLIGDYRTDPQGLPQSIHTGSGLSYLHQDPLGSVTALTGADGTLQKQHTYDPFGIATATPVEGVTAPQNPFGFTGQLNDQVLAGKQDLRARTYDPATGRFTGRDPIGLRVTDPYVSAYVYAEAAPTRLTDPSGEDPAPGNGWWIGARGSYQHNFALRMAYEQEVAQHGAENVYADLPGANAVWGGKTMTYPTYWSDIAEPDLVVAGVPTPQGAGFAIWDVKPASTYGRSRTASVDKLAGYIQGFHNEFGWPVVAGDPIVPEARPYPKDPNGDEGVMLIFNGAEWNHFGIPDVAPNHRYPDSDIAPLGETDGLIYYKLDKLQRERGRGRWGAALSEFHAQGAEVGSSQVWVCRPTGIPNFASNPLQVIGTTGGANTSSLASRTALSGYGPGPLAAIDPMPFRPVVHSHIESRVTGMSIDFSLRGLAGATVSTVLNGLAMGSPAGMVGRTAVVGAGRVITPVLEELFVLAA